MKHELFELVQQQSDIRVSMLVASYPNISRSALGLDRHPLPSKNKWHQIAKHEIGASLSLHYIVPPLVPHFECYYVVLFYLSF